MPDGLGERWSGTIRAFVQLDASQGRERAPSGRADRPDPLRPRIVLAGLGRAASGRGEHLDVRSADRAG